jgi:hypothetical protein
MAVCVYQMFADICLMLRVIWDMLEEAIYDPLIAGNKIHLPEEMSADTLS